MQDDVRYAEGRELASALSGLTRAEQLSGIGVGLSRNYGTVGA